jgi:hypothetical protein
MEDKWEDKLSRHLSEKIGQTNGVCVCNTHHLSYFRVVAFGIFDFLR